MDISDFLTREEVQKLLKSRVSFIYKPYKVDTMARDCWIEPDNKISLYYTCQNAKTVAINHMTISRPFRDSIDDPWLINKTYTRFKEFKRTLVFTAPDKIMVEEKSDNYYVEQYESYMEYMRGKRWPIFLMTDELLVRLSNVELYQGWVNSGKPVYSITNNFIELANNDNLLCSDEQIQFPHESFLLMFKDPIKVPFLKNGVVEAIYIHQRNLYAIFSTSGRQPEFVKFLTCDTEDNWLSLRYYVMSCKFSEDSEINPFVQMLGKLISGLLYLLAHPINNKIVSQKNKKEDAPFTIWNVEPSIRKPTVPNNMVSTTPIIRRGPLDKTLYILGATKQKGYTKKNGTWVEPIDTTRWFLPENLLPRLR